MGLINMSDPKYFGYTVNKIKSNVNLANMHSRFNSFTDGIFCWYLH
jgi:hypothetical protein